MEKNISETGPTTWEQLIFGLCLFRLSFRLTSAKGIASCMGKMEKMVIKCPALIYLLILRLSISPTFAHRGLLFLMTLPDQTLVFSFRDDPYFNNIGCEPSKIRDLLLTYLHAIEFCFGKKLGTPRLGKPLSQKSLEIQINSIVKSIRMLETKGKSAKVMGL